MANNPIRSVTLMDGNSESPEATGRELLRLAQLIRKETSLSVHVQTEPIFNRPLLKELGEAADTIGISLEFFDNKVRREICPDQSRAFSQEDYMRSWEMAVSCFGWGKVLNTNIIGFDEDYETILQGIERAAGIGVMTSILWLRTQNSRLGDYIPSYIGKEDRALQLHMDVGKILVDNTVDTISLQNAGCPGCHGCNATREAVLWARTASGKQHYVYEYMNNTEVTLE